MPPPLERATPAARPWWIALAAVVMLALALRGYDLARKPLHHDESVNALLLEGVVRPPHVYAYDPRNYHGPTLFYFAWIGVSLAGFTAVGIRLVPVAAGLATVLLPLVFVPQIGRHGALAAAALLASSSGAVYYSRYFIHESLFVCCTLAAVAGVVRWWTRRQPWFLYAAAVAAGLMFATKETAILSTGAIAVSGIGAALIASRAHRAAGGRPIEALRDRGGVNLVARAGLIAAAVALLFYTSFLTRPQGAIAALETFAVWTRTGTTVHVQPWHAYLRWLAVEELPLLVLGGAGVAAAIVRPRDRFAAFCALWAVGVLAMYSLIPYKTPWLTLNAIVPLALSAGTAVERLRTSIAGSRAAAVVFGTIVATAAAGGSARAAWLSFWHYDSERSPYVYVHTSRDMMRLVDAVTRTAAVNPDTPIAVIGNDYFPLPWYLRGYRVGYYPRQAGDDAGIVVAPLAWQSELDAQLGRAFERTGPYVLRPGVHLLVYLRRDLRRDAR